MIIDKQYKRQFVNAYIDCALWCSLDDSDNPLDDNLTRGDLPRVTYIKMAKKALQFIKDNTPHLVAIDYSNVEYSNASLAGHDLWLTSNGHGAGYWDRDLGYRGDILTTKAMLLGEDWLYIGDDNQIYI